MESSGTHLLIGLGPSYLQGQGQVGLEPPCSSSKGDPHWARVGAEVHHGPYGPPALPAAEPGPHNSPEAWHLREHQGSGRFTGSDKAISILE